MVSAKLVIQHAEQMKQQGSNMAFWFLNSCFFRAVVYLSSPHTPEQVMLAWYSDAREGLCKSILKRLGLINLLERDVI